MNIKILKVLVGGLLFWILQAHLWAKQDNSFLGIGERAYKKWELF